MKYEDALALFLAYNPDSTPLHMRLKTERKHFKELLCHPKFGLCVYIVLEQFIVFKSDETDLEEFFYDFLKSLQEQDKIDRLCIDNDFITKLVDTVDTEWDRKLIYVLLGASRYRKELSGLGIDSDNVCSLTENVVSIIEERNNAKMAAKDMVALRLKSKIERIEEKVALKEKQYSLKKDRWTKTQLDELEEEISDLKERGQSVRNLIKIETKQDKKRINQMVKRTQKQLIEENRLGLRKSSSGRPMSLDEEDEKFILNCIESKSTAHGRRHDAVMYLHHRVKKADFLKLANYNQLARGLKPIKSATTVYSRGRPKYRNSIQARRHLGLGLFCSKKPPKAESNDNELTHHQRAHKKNILTYLCGPETASDDGHEFNFMWS